MIKKVSIFVLVVSLLLVLLSSACVQPAELAKVEQLTILKSSAEVEFPSNIHFSLLAKNDVDITDVRLHYIVDQESYAQVTSEVYIDFVPNTTVDVHWTWDMRKIGGLPPGAFVEYWWALEDANGEKIESIPVRIVRFNDDRFSWQGLTEGKVIIYWYEGTQSFAEEVMSVAQQALVRLAEDTGAYLKKPVKLFIYASTQDLQESMIFPQEWTGGVAYPRYGTIAIGIAPGNLSWGRGAIVHELTHLVIHQMTFNPYAGLPTWLDEGLAMYAEGALGAEFTAYLKKAIAKDSLISVPSLSSPFSAYAEESYLSYAQSYSLVEFLITSYGRGKMLELLSTFSQGSSYDEAFTKVYGFDMPGLDTLWRSYVIKKYQAAEVKTTAMSPALIGTLTEQVGSSDSLYDILNWKRGNEVGAGLLHHPPGGPACRA